MNTYNRIVMSWPVVISSLVGWVLLAVLYLWPASYWFEVRSVQVADGPATPIMAVDREIHRPFRGRWTVNVRRWDNGWVVACVARGENDYSPLAKLPATLTLDWWTDGKCPMLAPGRYTMTTSWIVEGRALMPDKQIKVESNIWTVGEKS